jgi:L-amino acid N-acyltransferase YncA
VIVRDATASDLEAIRGLYNALIPTTTIRRDPWGRGVGRALPTELAERALDAGMHVMIAAIDGHNDASIEFHRRLGFVEVARMPEVGHKFGRWLDLVLMQRVLDPGGRR